MKLGTIMKRPKMEEVVTKENIKLARDVFMAMAAVNTLRPIVEGYKSQILADMRPKSKRSGRVITATSRYWAMTDDDAKIFFKRCDEEKEKAGLSGYGPGICPLLKAESALIDAKNALIDAIAPKFGIGPQFLSYDMESREKFITINLELFARYIGRGAK